MLEMLSTCRTFHAWVAAAKSGLSPLDRMLRLGAGLTLISLRGGSAYRGRHCCLHCSVWSLRSLRYMIAVRSIGPYRGG